jgi:hypothetical protein
MFINCKIKLFSLISKKGKDGLFFLIFLFCCLFSSEAWSDSNRSDSSLNDKNIIIVFRYDDFSAVSSTDLELKLIDSFAKHHTSCTFAVIPFVCSGNTHNPLSQSLITLPYEKIEILKKSVEAGTLDIALHGYSHQTLPRKKGYSEFNGLDKEIQLSKMKEGKNFLEDLIGCQITTFVPPWNTYDLNTIKAMEKVGFKSLSADIHGTAIKSTSLKFLPFTCSLINVKDAIKSSRSLSDIQPVIVVLFHPYDFLEINKQNGIITFQEFERLIGWLTSQNDIHVMSMTQACREDLDLTVYRYIDNTKRFFVKAPAFVPLFLRGNSGVYLSSIDVSSFKEKLHWLSTALFFLSLILISTAITALVFLFMRLKSLILSSFLKVVLLVLLVLFFGFNSYNIENYGYLDAYATAILLGAMLGSWGVQPWFTRRKKMRVNINQEKDFNQLAKERYRELEKQEAEIQEKMSEIQKEKVQLKTFLQGTLIHEIKRSPRRKKQMEHAQGV